MAFPKDVDAWLKIGQDGAVSLYTGKVEFGQGIQTAFGQLVADELDVPFGSVNVVMGSTDQVPYDNPTVGSQSMRSTDPWSGRRPPKCGNGCWSWLRSSSASRPVR